MYPASLKIYNTVNMLICVQKYQFELRQIELEALPVASGSNAPTVLPTLGDVEVVLVIDDLKIISFDQYAIKLPSSVQYDD